MSELVEYVHTKVSLACQDVFGTPTDISPLLINLRAEVKIKTTYLLVRVDLSSSPCRSDDVHRLPLNFLELPRINGCPHLI